MPETNLPSVVAIALDKLVPFRDHPFVPYEGQRLEDMVESIRANGVLAPVIVRPHEEKGKYEILSGHNRVLAAKEAGLETVPAAVVEGLDDDAAMLVVMETNLVQRSFADLRHSERAAVIATLYEAMKKNPGYRADLREAVEDPTCVQLERRLDSRAKLSLQLGMDRNTVTRYLRVNELAPQIKERLDKGEISLCSAVFLSFLRPKEQDALDALLADGRRVSIKQAETLREESAKGKLGADFIRRVLEPGYYPDEKIKPVKLSHDFLAPYFSNEQSEPEIEEIIAEALREYFGRRG
jgi:ParB family chromosome partitioning protein